MKTTKHLFLVCAGLLLLSLAACKSKAKGTTSGSPVATAEKNVYKGVTNDSCAVEVSFGSYGSGIDGKALDQVLANIDSKKLSYTSRAAGREGERRLCLPLTELKGKEKEEFIGRLKKIAAEGELVSVSIR